MEVVGITGGNGFIGTYLRHYFDEKGIQYKCFKGDLLNENEIEEYFEKNKIHQIIHLVGTFDPPFENLINKNLLTTQKLLEVGSSKGLQKVIYASTGAVYGQPIKEESFESDPLAPETLYGLVKMFTEECVSFYKHNHNIQYVILRYPNVYGKGNNKGVIYNFLNNIKNSGKLIIEGDGNQVRDFLHVSDACKAIYKALEYGSSDTFNITSDVRLSINDLVAEFKKKYDFKVEYKNRDNKLLNLSLNCDKAKKYLDFSATKQSLLI